MAGIDVNEVIYISTLTARSCPVCRRQTIGGEDWEESVNHVLKVHGWKLIHVGADWADDRDGKTISHTVAVLGRP